MQCKNEGCTNETRGEAFDVCWVCWNKDKIAENQKAYREANKDKIKAYREANKDKIKAYREANKDKIAENKKAYYEANKDKIKAYYEANKDKREEAFYKVRGWCKPIKQGGRHSSQG